MTPAERDVLNHVRVSTPYFETEYNGRMETFCFYCGKYQAAAMPEHWPNCVYTKLIQEHAND